MSYIQYENISVTNCVKCIFYLFIFFTGWL